MGERFGFTYSTIDLATVTPLSQEQIGSVYLEPFISTRRSVLVLLLYCLFLPGCAELPFRDSVEFEAPLQKFQKTSTFASGLTFHREFLLSNQYPEPVLITGVQLRVVDETGKDYPVADTVAWWEVAWVNRERHGALLNRESVDDEALVLFRGDVDQWVAAPDTGFAAYSNEPLVLQGAWKRDSESPALKVCAKVNFTRVNRGEANLRPILAKTFWAGDSGKKAVPQECPWKLVEGEKTTGVWPAESRRKAVWCYWFEGPGTHAPHLPNDISDEDLPFSAKVEPQQLPSALGVVVHEYDTELKGWR